MVKRINVAYDDKVHSLLSSNKEDLKNILGLKRLSWEEYFLELSKRQVNGTS